MRRARQMMLTGAMVSAATALNWGLVNEIVPAEQLLPRAAGLAETVAALRQNQPLAFGLHIEMLAALAMPQATLDIEQAMLARIDGQLEN